MLIYIVPFVFLTLIPTIWKKRMQSHKVSFVTGQFFRFMLGIIYLLFLQYIIVLDTNLLGVIHWVIVPVLILLFIDTINPQNGAQLLILIPIVLSLFLVFYLVIYPATLVDDKYELARQHTAVKDEKLKNMNIEHVVVVPRGYAIKKSQQLIGKLQNPTFFQLGEMSLQKINEEIYWVAPLEYAGFFKALKGEPIPGYIRVSAENRNSNAQLVRVKMKYVPSAVLANKLEIAARKKYPELIFLGTSFEPDDNNDGKPYYVISYGHYTHLRRIPHIDGVIIFDPQNGKMEKYETGEVPAFVDQVYPDWLAEDYNHYYGKYKYGFWASVFENRGDLHEPTEWNSGDSVIGVFGRDNQMYWFTDHTTLNKSDTSMVGYSMMNSRTGQLIYYTGASGFKNGKEALQNVNNTFRKDVWRGTQPKLYGIYGHDTWVIPVVDPDNEFREVALVHAESGKVIHADSKAKAYEIYKRELAMQNIKSDSVPTDISNFVSLNGVIKRYIVQAKLIKFILENDDRIFIVDTEKIPYSIFTEKGDRVEIEYLDTGENTLTVLKFNNLSLDE